MVGTRWRKITVCLQTDFPHQRAYLVESIIRDLAFKVKSILGLLPFPPLCDFNNLGFDRLNCYLGQLVG